MLIPASTMPNATFATASPLTARSPQLALITCGGAYNRATRNYSDNVIVYAVPVV